MKLKLVSMMLGLMLVVLGSAWMFAQEKSDSKSNTRTITGCLSQEHGSSNSKEFLLTASDGSSTWEVRSDAVPLADHLGHTVTATGVVRNSTAHNLKEDAKGTAEDAHMKKGNTEHGHMTITDVQMVSSTCEK